MTLRVVGAGLGRTGTTSLKIALERLIGAPCYHMLAVRERPEDPDRWAAAYGGNPPDWREFFDGFGACVDWPAAGCWQSIAAAFPDALILLSTRDPDSWWTSAAATIFPAVATYFAPDAPADGWTAMGVAMMTSFTPDWREADAAKAAFVAHNDEVRRTAPADRLLEWQPGDGWEPLCERLGVPVPVEPFPHTNTTAEARQELGIEESL
jgi:sulfotransferase family protein